MYTLNTWHASMIALQRRHFCSSSDADRLDRLVWRPTPSRFPQVGPQCALVKTLPQSGYNLKNGIAWDSKGDMISSQIPFPNTAGDRHEDKTDDSDDNDAILDVYLSEVCSSLPADCPFTFAHLSSEDSTRDALTDHSLETALCSLLLQLAGHFKLKFTCALCRWRST